MFVDGLKRRWPAEDLTYVRLLGSTVLVLVLVPLVVLHLIVEPAEVGERMLEHAIR